MTSNYKLYNISYNKDGDFLEYFYVKKVSPFYGEIIDEFITLLKDQKTKKIIGIQISNLDDLNLMKDLETKND